MIENGAVGQVRGLDSPAVIGQLFVGEESTRLVPNTLGVGHIGRSMSPKVAGDLIASRHLPLVAQLPPRFRGEAFVEILLGS